MNIYIAYDHREDPVACVLADDKEKAEVAFMGMKCKHVRTEAIDPSLKGIGVHGVVFLFGFKEVSVGSGMGRHTIKILKRGL